MATTLFEELWASEAGIVEIRVQEETGMHQEFFEWPTQKEELYDYVHEQAKTKNVYYGVNLRRVRGGKAEDVATLNKWLWADVDKKTGATFASLLSAPLPRPQIIVDSGNGWHLYWKMAKPLDHDTAQAMMNGIADMLNGDRVGDPARILRVPGTMNHKTSPPHGVRVLRMKGLKHGWRTGDFYLPATTRERRKYAKIVGTGRGTRSEDLFKFAIDSLKKGMSEEDIYKAMLALPEGEKLLEMRTEDRRRRWVRLTVAKARRTIT